MNDLRVTQFGNPVLRKVSVEVDEVTPQIYELAEAMIKSMHDENGIGLAGPQIGVNKRIIAVGVDNLDGSEPPPPGLSPGEMQLWNAQPMVLINPKIINFSEELDVLEEGCLSIPGINVDVVRPAEIELEATVIFERGAGRVNRKIRMVFGNLLATCFQHEIDHLDGILFVDRASNEDKKMIKKSLKKLEKSTLKRLR